MTIMQAILVKYVSPTNTRGGGYSARASGGSVRVSRDYSLSDSADRARAALLLCEKMGWSGTLHEGTLPNGDHVFVFDNGVNAVQSHGAVHTHSHGRRNRSGSSRTGTTRRYSGY